jgi:hypothetical protein
MAYLKRNKLKVENLKPSNVLIKYSKDQQRYVGLISDWEFRKRPFTEFSEESKFFQPYSETFAIGWVFGILFFQLDLGYLF